MNDLRERERDRECVCVCVWRRGGDLQSVVCQCTACLDNKMTTVCNTCTEKSLTMVNIIG